MSCAELEQKISAYIDGELTGESCQRLTAHLQTCKLCKAKYEALKADELLIRGALASNPFDARLAERVRLEIAQTASVRSRFLFLRREFALAAAAALIAIGLGIAFLFISAPSEPPAQFGALTSSSGLTVKREGDWQPAEYREELLVGDVLRNDSNGPIELATPKGSKILLNQVTSVKIVSPSVVALLAGEVFAQINKEPFQVSCNGLQVIVAGTAFSVNRYKPQIVVTVAEGIVRCVTADAQRELRDGEQLVVGVDASQTVMRQVEAATFLGWTSLFKEAAARPAAPTPVTDTAPVVEPGIEEPIEVEKPDTVVDKPFRKEGIKPEDEAETD